MQNKELKKNLLRECPFCGGEAEARKEMGGTTWKVKCTRCSAEVGRYWFGRKKQAEIAWNSRATEAEIRNRAIEEFMEKLKAKIEEVYSAPERESEYNHAWKTVCKIIQGNMEVIAEQLKEET